MPFLNINGQDDDRGVLMTRDLMVNIKGIPCELSVFDIGHLYKLQLSAG